MPDQHAPTAKVDSPRSWSDLERRVGELAQLAQSPMSKREYFATWLEHVGQVLGTASCAIWTRGDSGAWQLESQLGFPSADVEPLVAQWRAQWQRAIESEPAAGIQVFADVSVSSGARDDSPAGRDPLLRTAVQPIVVEHEVVAALELRLPHGADDAERTARLAGVFADLARDFLARCHLRELRQRVSALGELDQFAGQVHQSLELPTVCFRVANEAARLVACDRVTVVVPVGSGWRVAAVSGVSTPDRRATQLRRLEALAAAVARAGEPVSYTGDDHELPLPIQSRVQTYLDAAHVRLLWMVPLAVAADARHGGHPVVAVLVFERFDAAPWTAAQQRRVEAVCRHSTTALAHAAELSRLPLLTASRLLQAGARQLRWRNWPRWATLLAGIVLGAAVLSVPADLAIRADGELQPVRRRGVFAPGDGVIEQLHVQHGDRVVAGQVLVTLQQNELDYEHARLLGELQTQQRRLDAIRAARLNFSRNGDRSDFDDLTAEEERWRASTASLERQLTILAEQQAALRVCSPLTGEVVTWNAEETLPLRPVRRGQRLLNVVDAAGPWRVEMRIRDYDVQHLLTARQQGEPVRVTFRVASQPATICHGQVEQIALATDLDKDGQPAVLVTASWDHVPAALLRPGASVSARIHCGRHSLGYVWFRDLLAVLRTRWIL